jgi:hypothetical protein
MTSSKSLVTWYHMLIVLASQLIFIPFAKTSFSIEEFSFWLSLSLFISLYLVVDFGYSQTYLKCNGKLISGHDSIPEYGDYSSDLFDDGKIKTNRYCNIEYISNFNYFTNKSFNKNSLFILAILSVLFYFLLGNRLDALENDIEYNISFILSALILFTQSHCFYLYNRLISFKNYTKVRFIEANVVLVRIFFIYLFFKFNLEFIYYFVFYFAGTLLLYVAHYINILSIGSIRIDKKRFRGFKEKAKFLKGQKRQGCLNVSSAIILNAFGLLGTQFQSSIDASLSLLTNKVFNVIKNFSQVPLISNIPDLIKLRNTKNFILAFKEFLKLHKISIFLFVVFSSMNYVFFSIVEIHYSSYIYLNHIYFLYFCILLLELNHSGFSQFYLTRNHIPFLIPSILSGISIIIIGWYIGQIYGALGLILAQGLVQLLFNNWYPVFLVYKEVNFEKNYHL